MGFIYMLTSPSGKSYIGQTTCLIQKRFEQHQKIKSRCYAIHNAIRRYGWENIQKDWYECPDEDLNFDEELLVRELGTLVPNGYNLMEGGGANGKPSEETRQKMSEAQKGEKNSYYGKTHSQKSRQKMSEANMGKSLSEETKQKISQAQTGENNHNYGRTGENNPNYGKSRSQETKQKISKALSGENSHWYGKKHTEESIQKMSKARLGEKNCNSKKVYQYTLDGKFVHSFASGGEAARALGKSSGSSIDKCARGKLNTAYGFKWSRVLH